MQKLVGPRARLAQGIDDVREYGRIAGFWQIARRAFANNSFDGVLTTIGLLMGSYVAGIRDGAVVIRTGIATSMAMGVSGLWGSWLAESAERGRELAELEKHSLTDLGQTKIGRASRMAVVVVSIVDGLAPFLSSMFVLIPLFFWPLMDDVVIGYALSMAVALVSLFVLGAWLGSISGASIIRYGVRTVIAGVVSIALSFLLGG
jgi:predicted membrane protein (TIGR00267 family)